MFEGEPDHLIPSTSEFLLESDMFHVAGRMIGHSFLHSGPSLAGLSPAIIHVLLGGAPETANLEIHDCPDIDVRETVRLKESKAVLSEEDTSIILQLALSWDLPGMAEENRHWLMDKLLLHAVIVRTTRQVKQLRKGLKETLVWPLLKERSGIIPLMFPRASDTLYTSQMILERITWPTLNVAEDDDDDDDDDDCSLETKCRITGFFRTFIETHHQEC